MARTITVAAAQMGPNNESAGREEIVERMLALLDQANRAQDMGRADRALDFGERLFAALPNPETATVLAEGYRLARRPEMLARTSQ